MNNRTLAPRQQALQYLIQARGTQVRGDLRDAIQAAIDLAENTKRSPTLNDYERLRSGRLTDHARPGLLMRCGKRRGKTWFFRYETLARNKEGRQVRRTIEAPLGQFPYVAVEEAHKLWEKCRARVKSGKTPMATNEKSSTVETVGQLLDLYLQEYSKPHKAASSHHHELLRVKRTIPENVRSINIFEFDTDAAEALLINICSVKGPGEANRVRSILSTAFNVGSGRMAKLRLPKPWLPRSHPNPITNIPRFPTTSEKYNPSVSDLQNYVRGLGELDMAGAILRLQLESFARVSEVSQMRWDEIDFVEGTWILPASRSKNGQAHRVMLSRQSLARLSEWFETQKSDYVFPLLTDSSRPVFREYPMQQLAKHRDILGINSKFSSHKIRHAGLSWLAKHGQGKEVRDRVSNHRQHTSADDDYQLHEFDEAAREWTQKWCDHIEMLESEYSNVLTFRGNDDG